MMLIKSSVIAISVLFLANEVFGASTGREDVHFAVKEPSEPETNSEGHSDLGFTESKSPNGNAIPSHEKPSKRPSEESERPSEDSERPSEDRERPSEKEQPRNTRVEEGEHPVGVSVNHPEFNSRMQNFHLNYELACSGHGCQNGGRCTTEFRLPGRAYGCNCGSKLGGPLCEIVDPCKNSPCPEGTLCLTTSALDSDCGRKCYDRTTFQRLLTRC